MSDIDLHATHRHSPAAAAAERDEIHAEATAEDGPSDGPRQKMMPPGERSCRKGKTGYISHGVILFIWVPAEKKNVRQALLLLQTGSSQFPSIQNPREKSLICKYSIALLMLLENIKQDYFVAHLICDQNRYYLIAC